VAAVGLILPAVERIIVPSTGLMRSTAVAGDQSMTNASVAVAANTFEGDFRVGRVLSRAVSVFSRRFATFFIVTLVAASPLILMQMASPKPDTDPAQALLLAGITLVLFIVLLMLSMVSAAVVLHGTFQDMRQRPVSLIESLKVGLRRFLPLTGLALAGSLLQVIGFALLVIPGLILYTMWFVSVAACVVERTGPWASLRRSKDLTKGHRWKIFGLGALILLLSFVNPVLQGPLKAAGCETVALIFTLIWTSLGSIFSSIVVAVTYYDLRAAKEGLDIEQIASVFD